MVARTVQIPGVSDVLFHGGIHHPDLWLWDSWVCHDQDKCHLYCLALARVAEDGSSITPADRNDFPFHIRHFVSTNQGLSWKDGGVYFTPGKNDDLSYESNVWSGSVSWMSPAHKLFGFTGIKKISPDRKFLQTICLGVTFSVNGLTAPPRNALSCPLRDYDKIIEAGYYLGPKNNLGANEGEEGGPILGWRDPFIFVEADGRIHLYWSAKIGPKTPAIAHAIIRQNDTGYLIDSLSPPITLPDAQTYTQAEVPKVYWDEKRDTYYMLISSCDRIYEGQPDSEVSKQQRLYKSHSPTGPWVPYKRAGSILPGFTNLFGASILYTDFETGDLIFIAPYTEQASPSLQLTFAPVFKTNIYHGDIESSEKNILQ